MISAALAEERLRGGRRSLPARVAPRALRLLAAAWMLLSNGCASSADRPLAPAPDSSADVGEAGPTTDARTPPDAGPMHQGAVFVRNRACIDCHQSPDAEDGILAGRLVPVEGTRTYAPNLTPDVETGIGGWLDEELVRAIRAGFDQSTRPLCEVMPRFYRMDDNEVRAIIAYLRSLPPVRRKVPPSICPPTKVPDAGAADTRAPDAKPD